MWKETNMAGNIKNNNLPILIDHLDLEMISTAEGFECCRNDCNTLFSSCEHVCVPELRMELFMVEAIIKKGINTNFLL
jgi:hypothetical protein